MPLTDYRSKKDTTLKKQTKNNFIQPSFSTVYDKYKPSQEAKQSL